MDAETLTSVYDVNGSSNVQRLNQNPLTTQSHKQRETHIQIRPTRILLCFIDARPSTKNSQPTAHYAMIALPSSYEAAAQMAYKAFQNKMTPNNIHIPGDVALMIKGFVKFGDSSLSVSQPASNIWAEIYPQEDWNRIVRDGDEILVCPKVAIAPMPMLAPVDSVTRTTTPGPTTAGAGGPLITLFCKPLGSSKYRQERVPFVRTFEELKFSALQAFGHLNESPVSWSKDSFQLYLNTTSIMKSGGRDRPNRHTSKTTLQDRTWPSAAEAVMNDKSLFWEVEVVPLF